MLLPHGVHKAYRLRRRLRERQVEPTRGAVLALALLQVSYCILEYYAYSISPGQAVAWGGHALCFPERGAV